MDKELTRYYEESFDTFASQGWIYFLEDMETLQKAIDDLSSVENVETLWFRKGQLDILNLILERKKSFEAAWEEVNT